MCLVVGKTPRPEKNNILSVCAKGSACERQGLMTSRKAPFIGVRLLLPTSGWEFINLLKRGVGEAL